MTKRDEEPLTETFDIEDPEGYDDADSLLGQAVPAMRWPILGTTLEGVITDVDTSTQLDPATGKVRTFANGRPRRQVILTLQTKDGIGSGDDGRRRLFIKGFMVKPFREAIAKAGAPGPRPGHRVKVTYSADGEAAKGLNAPKLFTVEYSK